MSAFALPWGVNPSSFIDSDGVKDIITKLLRTFQKIFPTAYKNALLDSVISRKKSYTPPTYLLPPATAASTPVKSGFLMKRGANVKSWKRRWFRALNESDNFAISYGKKEHGDEEDEIGRFSCCGYHVELFTQDEALDYSTSHGFKLVPQDDTHRCWLLIAPDEDQKNEWILAFTNACRRTAAERDSDPIIRDAFDHTLQLVQQIYGYYGSSIDDAYDTLGAGGHGDEMDRLCWLLRIILKREVLDEVLESIMNDNIHELIQFQREARATQSKGNYNFGGSGNSRAAGRSRSRSDLAAHAPAAASASASASSSAAAAASANATKGGSSSSSGAAGSSSSSPPATRARNNSLPEDAPQQQSRLNSISNATSTFLASLQPFSVSVGRTDTLDDYIVQRSPPTGAKRRPVPFQVRQLRATAVSRYVYDQIRPAVRMTWEHVREKALAMSANFLSEVAVPNADAILEVEEEVEEMLYNPVSELIHDVQVELLHRLLGPVAAVCGAHIMDAYEMALRTLFTHMSAAIARVVRDPSSATQEMHLLSSLIDYGATVSSQSEENVNGGEGLLMPSREILDTMASVHLNSLQDGFVGKITPREIYCRVVDDLRDMLLAAIESFTVSVTSMGVTNRIILTFNEVVLQLCTDMTTRMRHSFYLVMVELSESCVVESMLQPSDDIFKATKKAAVTARSVDGSTPLVPRHLLEVIHVHFIGERMVREMVSCLLIQLVDRVFAGSGDRLHGVVTQLCDTLPIQVDRS